MTTATPRRDRRAIDSRTGKYRQARPPVWNRFRPRAANTGPGLGLVYDAQLEDWLNFLCGTGRLVRPRAARSIRSNLNSPSIAIGDLGRTAGPLRRTLTTSARMPRGIRSACRHLRHQRQRIPRYFLDCTGRKAGLRSPASQPNGCAAGAISFGAISWSDGEHQVRSPVAIQSLSLAGPPRFRAMAHP